MLIKFGKYEPFHFISFFIEHPVEDRWTLHAISVKTRVPFEYQIDLFPKYIESLV